jgi:hypothetical protein
MERGRSTLPLPSSAAVSAGEIAQAEETAEGGTITWIDDVGPKENKIKFVKMSLALACHVALDRRLQPPSSAAESYRDERIVIYFPGPSRNINERKINDLSMALPGIAVTRLVHCVGACPPGRDAGLG